MNIEKIRIPSEKGEIAVAVHRPEAGAGKLAVLCPGFLDSKDYAHLVRLAEDLAGRGFVVARFDPTGTWESGGEIADYTVTQYLADIKTVIDFMIEGKEYSEILVGGHSRGGQMSILYAARDSRITTVLGIMAPSGSTAKAKYEEWKNSGVRVSHRDLPDGVGGEKEFAVPYSYMEDMSRYDVLEDAKNVHVPVMLVTGEMDEVVLPSDVEAIYNNANEPKRFAVISGIGHDYRHNEGEIATVNAKIFELLDSLETKEEKVKTVEVPVMEEAAASEAIVESAQPVADIQETVARAVPEVIEKIVYVPQVIEKVVYKEAEATQKIGSARAKELWALFRNKFLTRKKAKMDRIVTMAIEKKKITNDDVQKLLRVSDTTATRYLTELVKQGILKKTGVKAGTAYEVNA